MPDHYDDENKPMCPTCGSLDYLGDLRDCPHCDDLHCNQCSLGEDDGCPGCQINNNTY